MNAPRSAPPDLPGFTLVEGIGGGGFADVFRYRQHHPNRDVAIKVLRAEHLSEHSLQQFSNEADLMAQVSTHPYIVTIYTSGVSPDGRPFIVMEHYPGDHFGVRARGGRLSVPEVLRVGIQVAAAVETAHRAGILHRDIKPANILTSEYGRPGLTDFGIAGVQVDGAVQAAAGLTVAFSPPEVLLDQHPQGSVAADVYAMAATIYALLAGHSPVWVPGGDNTEPVVLQRAVAGQVQPLRRQDAPATLQHLVAHGLATDPRARPASMLALAQMLQTVEQELALPPTAIEVRDDAPSARRVRVDDDEDGTRRSSVQVVHPDPEPAPLPPGASTIGSPVPAPPPAFAEPAAVGARPAADDDPDTVRRSSASPVESAPSAPTSGPRWVLWGAVAAVAVVLVAGGIAATRSDTTAAATTTTAPPVAPSISLRPPLPDPPDTLTAATGTDGTLTVSFAAPEPGQALTYRVARTTGEFPDGSPWFQVAASPDAQSGQVVIEQGPLPPGDAPCVTVSVVTDDGRISDPSPAVCATPAG